MSSNVNLQYASSNLLSDEEFMRFVIAEDVCGPGNKTSNTTQSSSVSAQGNRRAMNLVASSVAQVGPPVIRTGGLRIGGSVTQQPGPTGLRISRQTET